MKTPDSVKGWHKTWFYVKNRDNSADGLNLPEYSSVPPRDRGWNYLPAEEGPEVKAIDNWLRVHAHPTPDDVFRTWISRRVSPLQARPHLIGHMEGDMDPCRHSTHSLSKKQIWDRLRVVAKTDSLAEWAWQSEPLSRDNPPEMVCSGLHASAPILPLFFLLNFCT